MKYVFFAVLLLSTTVIADDGAAVEAQDGGGLNHQEWPSLNELWSQTETANGIKEALVAGTPGLEILLAYEYSDFDDPGGLDPAHALITRTRLDYLTGEYKGFGAYVQAQYVGPINDHYSPENPNYDTVADPESFRFHQAYLSYAGYDSAVRFGAQEILLDNQRFIGNVGWRLNAQSFNAMSIANHSIRNITLYYAYADSINATDGSMNHDRQYHLLNAGWNAFETGQLAAFAYLQRNDNAGLDRLDTYGMHAWGKSDTVRHELLLALQRDAYYGSAFGELDLDILDAGAGVEYISGGNDTNERFQTLNGTAHKFNGWADQFLATGGGLEAGLVDLYGQISTMATDKIKLTGVYHYFNTADETAAGFSGEYGQEIDLMAVYPVCPEFDLSATYAYYIKGENDADNFTQDETVLWLRGTMRF